MNNLLDLKHELKLKIASAIYQHCPNIESQTIIEISEETTEFVLRHFNGYPNPSENRSLRRSNNFVPVVSPKRHKLHLREGEVMYLRRYE